MSHTDTSLSPNSPPPAAAAAAAAPVIVVVDVVRVFVFTVGVKVSSSTCSARRTPTKSGGSDDNVPACKGGLLLLLLTCPFLPDLDNGGFVATPLRAVAAGFATFNGVLITEALSPATGEPKSPTRAEAGKLASSLFVKSFALEALRWRPDNNKEKLLYSSIIV